MLPPRSCEAVHCRPVKAGGNMVTRRAVSPLFFVQDGRASETEPGAQLIECWREAGYDCCALWVQHIRSAGFTVDDQIVESLGPMQRLLGTPAALTSCHSALVADFALEGHVPAHAIRRLLRERPNKIAGLAVPGMPTGTPGMEIAGR